MDSVQAGVAGVSPYSVSLGGGLCNSHLMQIDDTVDSKPFPNTNIHLTELTALIRALELRDEKQALDNPLWFYMHRQGFD